MKFSFSWPYPALLLFFLPMPSFSLSYVNFLSSWTFIPLNTFHLHMSQKCHGQLLHKNIKAGLIILAHAVLIMLTPGYSSYCGTCCSPASEM